MIELVVLALFLSLDNVRLAGCLGLLSVGRHRWWLLAAMMGAVEATAPFVGAMAVPTWLANATPLRWAGPALLLVAALLTLAGFRAVGTFRPVWMIYSLPFLFGIDNLVAGAAIGASGTPALGASLLIGGISGSVSLATMALAAGYGARLGDRWAPAPTAIAVCLALSFFLIA